ncbi:hypothetical protein G7Y31_09130 [Corynebacterium lizhenjunii]|uniref:Secreted protein n=1 Tax=Corynebacterium lizhenjunii TaxID=2709394 RepID=A0A7T0KEB7_9CORY|nr:hypothetical protein [Corynebacterium lizhenjunii]QPK78700.1 hypothetical protein G7Y31_09130 [Corynebacterium lizhenjunii]
MKASQSKSTRAGIIAASVAVTAIAIGGGVAIATGAHLDKLTAENHDLFKPGAEMMFTANCPDGSDRADLSTSFGEQTVMSPAADAGSLIGYINAPESIGPGPDDGYHTFTVTCGDGQSLTQRFADDGNGTNAEAEGEK